MAQQRGNLHNWIRKKGLVKTRVDSLPNSKKIAVQRSSLSRVAIYSSLTILALCLTNTQGIQKFGPKSTTMRVNKFVNDC